MIAALQRVLALVWALALAIALLVVLQRLGAGGDAAPALLLVALLLAGHAVVLGVEFVWMHAANRDDPAPRATLAQVVRAWWGEIWAAPVVFLWRQPFRSQAYAEQPRPSTATTTTSPATAATPATSGTSGRRGVLLVHGYLCNRGFWLPWLERLHRRGITTLAVTMEPAFGSIDDYRPTIDAAVRRLHAATGVPPLVVAHSMGGLALRRWRAEPGNARRIHGAITLGSPHQGTRIATVALSTNVRQMRVGGPWLAQLRALEAAHGADDFSRFVCYFGHCDNIVFPAHNATLPGADNRHLSAVAHVDLAAHPEPWAEVLRQLLPDAR